MATTLTELPIVDMSLVDGDDTDRAMFRQSLLAATHEVGFFYLVGHGIDRDTRDRLFDTVRAFFALPEAAKFDVEMLKSPHFRGYTRFGGEYTQGAIDWREQIDLAAEYPSLGSDPGYLRLDGPNLWPELAGFREVITDWQKRCGELGLRLMREWASSLGTDRAFFDDAFAQRPSTLMKLVRYPGREDGPCPYPDDVAADGESGPRDDRRRSRRRGRRFRRHRDASPQPAPWGRLGHLGTSRCEQFLSR